MSWLARLVMVWLFLAVTSPMILAQSGRALATVRIGQVDVSAYNRGECVEFARRVSTAISPECTLPFLGSNGGASDLWAMAEQNRIVERWLPRPNNGLDPPGVWDFIVWSKARTPGHVGVIRSVSRAGNRLNLTIIEQNWSRTRAEAKLICTYNPRTSRYTLAKRGGYTCLGWLRPLYGLRPPNPYLNRALWVNYYVKPNYAASWVFTDSPDEDGIITVRSSNPCWVKVLSGFTTRWVETVFQSGPIAVDVPVKKGNYAYFVLQPSNELRSGTLEVYSRQPPKVVVTRITQNPATQTMTVITEFPTSGFHSKMGYYCGTNWLEYILPYRLRAYPNPDIGPNVTIFETYIPTRERGRKFSWREDSRFYSVISYWVNQ